MQLAIYRFALWLKLVRWQGAAVCLLILLSSTAYGVDPTRKIAQYSHTTWRMQDGFIDGIPNAFVQTQDGYVWIATESGLFRTDGVRFTPLQLPEHESLASAQVINLLSAQDGSLWIGTGKSLEHLQNGKLTKYLSHGRVNAIVQSGDGEIWIARSRVSDKSGPLCKVTGRTLACFGEGEGVPNTSSLPLAQTADGQLWMAGTSEVVKWKNGRSVSFALAALQPRKGLSGITSLAAAQDGSLWVGIDQTGPGLGLEHIVHDEWKPVVHPGFDGSRLQVTSLLIDSRGALWIGTEGQGLYRIYGDEVDCYLAASGLSSDTVWSLFEDHEQNVWVGTDRGVDQFRDLSVVSFSTKDGLKAASVESVLVRRDGSVLMGGSSLGVMQHGKLSVVDESRGLPGHQVTAMFEDHLGRLWLGVDDGLFVYLNGKFTLMKDPQGGSTGPIKSLAEDRDGVMWAIRISGTPKLIQYLPSGTARYFIAPGIQEGEIASITADPEKGVWLGLRRGDLAFYREGKLVLVPFPRAANSATIQQLTTTAGGSVLGSTDVGVVSWHHGNAQTLGLANGLPCLSIYSVAVDRKSTLWIYSACGLVSVAENELQRWWAHPDAKLKVDRFDALDGVFPSNPVFNPKVAVAADGKIWFAASGMLQQIDPARVIKNSLAPPVHIQTLIADRQAYPVLSGSRLPPLTREIEIDYTALSFTIPKKVQFRYKLDELESQWQDVGTRRQAFYTSLQPGNYHFHVIACNNDGLWNQVGATLNFSIAPAYYQTVWFQVLCALVLAGMLWLLYLARLQQAKAQLQESLAARMEERERIARELHDTLLQGVQGVMLRFQAVMKTLPTNEPARQIMGQVLDRADQVLLEGRQRVRDLRAEGDTADNLPERLKVCAEELAQEYPTTFKFTIAGDTKPLDPTVGNEAYQIGREALTNAFQHAKGTQIEAELTYKRASLRLIVRDDGQGIEQNVLGHGRSGHWGLSGMRERAEKIGGRLSIWSLAGSGTEIDLVIPARVAYLQKSKASPWARLMRAMNLFGKKP